MAQIQVLIALAFSSVRKFLWGRELGSEIYAFLRTVSRFDSESYPRSFFKFSVPIYRLNSLGTL